MKKQFLLFLFAAFIALITLSACAQGPTPITKTTPTPSPPSNPTPRLTSTPTPLPYPSMQLENNLPLGLLSPRRSQELLDNHIGVWFEGYDRYYDTDFVYNNGFKWMRIGSVAESWSVTLNAETLSDEIDRTISEYSDQGVEIVLILQQGTGAGSFFYTFQSDDEIEQYLEYVRFVVSHFKGRIHYYEIWNEPGLIAPKDYVNLVEQTVPVIREIDPDAKIIIGAIPGDWVNEFPGYGEFQRFSVDNRYLNELLLSGVVSLVDGISWHPLYDNVPSDPYYQVYPQIVQEIKDMAASEGFKGEYFADEMMWTTVDEEDWNNGPPISQFIAAKYYARTIIEHLGLGVNVTIQTFFQVPFLDPIHNLCDTLAGAEPTDIPLSFASEIANIRHYAFVLPDGDKLLALWTNGIAVENDPGIETTLTIPGFSASKVIGIDILNSFEQELITETENGDLIIPNLLVKDSPIIIKFNNVDIMDISEYSITPPTESSFAGTWLGFDASDNRAASLILTQTGNQVEGTFSDSSSEKPDGTLIQPGFSGQGSGYLVSPTEAKVVFNLTRSDGVNIVIEMRLLLSARNTTLTLEIPEQSSPFVFHRQE